MSRQKLFNMIKSRGTSEVGRNPFDLTNRHVYTQKAAKITPVTKYGASVFPIELAVPAIFKR